MFSREFPVEDYSLAETLPSGQAFRWVHRDGGWESVIHGRWVRLQQQEKGFLASSIENPQGWNWLEQYLQTSVDIKAVISTFPRDEHMARAVDACRGLRLLRQDPWECLASFILSSTKQIVQIQQIVQALCSCYGEPVKTPPGQTLFSFPSPATIAALSETKLRACKMGFRAPYLRETARMVVAGEVNLERIGELDVESARAHLMLLPGVGRKIADCVLLFAYGFQQAFPVDVWVMKALQQLYFSRRRPSPKRLAKFVATYFGPFSGYAQQYLFHYMRTKAVITK